MTDRSRSESGREAPGKEAERPASHAPPPPVSRPEVKICGLCRPADAAVAVAAGADYLGVVLAAVSPRTQPLAAARAILAERGRVPAVGVFVDAAADDVVRAAEALGLAAVQLHGDEPPEVADRLRAAGLSVWKALRVMRAEELTEELDRWRGRADALLLEGVSHRGPGGVGASFPWAGLASAVPARPLRVKLVVAGGLTPANVEQAVSILDPDVVDVSSGVEEAVGRKSQRRVRAFIARARPAATARGAPGERRPGGLR